MRRHNHLRPANLARSARLVVAFAVVSVTAVGCSGKSDSSRAAASTPASSAPTTPAPTVEEVALKAYGEFQAAFLAAGDPPNPDSPGLAAHATGQELDALRQSFTGFKAEGLAMRGTIDSAPKVTVAAPDRVLIRDCYDDHTGLYQLDGTRRDKEDPRRHLVTVTLVQADGAWKVSEMKHEGEGCTP